jgi:hypothetical protein
MKIRIRSTFTDGTIQFEGNQILDLPDELAQRFIDDQVADAVDDDEASNAPRLNPGIAGFVPPPRRKSQKGNCRA